VDWLTVLLRQKCIIQEKIIENRGYFLLLAGKEQSNVGFDRENLRQHKSLSHEFASQLT
jgi:hypothetical protein